jgi:hypothetical protein
MKYQFARNIIVLAYAAQCLARNIIVLAYAAQCLIGFGTS